MIGILSNIVGGMIFLGILILLPIFFVEVKGFEMAEASLAMVPFVLIMEIITRFAERIIKRIDCLILLFVGYLFMIAGFTMLIYIDADLYFHYLLIMISVSGMGLGMIWVASDEMCRDALSRTTIALRNGFFAFVRIAGGIMGTALFLLIMLSFTSYYSSDVVKEGIHKVENSMLSPDTKHVLIAHLEKGKPSLFDDYTIPEIPQFQEESIALEIVAEMNQTANSHLVKAMAKAFFAGLMISCIFLFLLPFVRLEENGQEIVFQKGRSY